MNVLYLLSIFAGVVLIFVEKGVKPLAIERIKTNAHSIIGLFSSILVFIQPFMAFMRPSPESPKRKIFNFSHNFVGLSALILAMTAILLATILDSAKLDQKVTLPVGKFQYYLQYQKISLALLLHFNPYLQVLLH